MPECPNPYRGHRFPREVIAHAVRLYLRFALSFRDVEELLAERGVVVSYETVRRWVAKFGAYYADELRRREARAGRTWHLDGLCHVGRWAVASRPSTPSPPVPECPSPYRGHRFPREVIAHAVRLYLRFALSYRDVEELLVERGVQVSYETVRRWVAKFGAHYAGELRRREVRRGRTWHLDEMAVRVGGRLQWLWRAVDEHGQTLDVLLQAQRDTAAAERFFRCLLAVTEHAPPDRITTDKLGSYAAALARLPELGRVEHVHVRSAARCNNRVEQAHQATRVRERVMRRFKSAPSAQRFLDAFSRVGNLFRPGRHRLGAAAYRAAMRERVATWREVADLRAA